MQNESFQFAWSLFSEVHAVKENEFVSVRSFHMLLFVYLYCSCAMTYDSFALILQSKTNSLSSSQDIVTKKIYEPGKGSTAP